MSASSIVHNDTIIFDGKNYTLWRNCLLYNLWTLCPNIERFIDVGFYPPMDPQNLSLADEKNLHLEDQVSNEIIFSLSLTVNLFLTIVKRKSSHEKWTKLKEIFGGSISNIVSGFSEEISFPSHHEDLQVASTSGRNEFSSSPTSPTCGKTQRKYTVSGVGNCNVDIVLTNDDPSSLSHCNVSSLDLRTSCKNNAISPFVGNPCISS